MPSTFAEPTIEELLEAFEDGVRANRDKHVDAREGAVYQYFSGPAAILWSRAARRTTDLWRAVYFDSAEGTDLTELLADRYSFARVPDAYGLGTARLRRPTTAAGGGTVWRGTRLAVFGSHLTEPVFYVVTTDQPVGPSDLTVTVRIRAARPGPGTAILINAAGAARVDDPLWDPTWGVDHLECADGTAFEPAPAARARFRDHRRAARAGFVEGIVQACKDAGATHALLFPSDYAGDEEDHGLNMAYVGDASFEGDEVLVRRVTLALERWRVLGDQLQVRPLTRTNLTIKARVHLWASPTGVAQDDTLKRLVGAVLGYFEGGSSGFAYQRDALAGAMLKAAPAAQFVEFDEPTADAGVMAVIDGLLNFPASLSRYRVAPNDITLTLLPPL